MAVGIAVVLAAGWLVVTVYLHWAAAFAPPGGLPVDTVTVAALLWVAGLAIVDIPAVIAGAVAVSTCRRPGTGPGLWWAARVAFWAALTGPLEAAGLFLLWLGVLAFRSVAGILN